MANFGPRGGSARGPGGPPPQQRSWGEERGHEARQPHANDRKRMLDLSREGHLKYDLREVLAKGTLPAEQHAAFIATIFSKGSRQSTVEAKDWVTSKLNEQIITKAERDAINTLIDRYSKWR